MKSKTKEVMTSLMRWHGKKSPTELMENIKDRDLWMSMTPLLASMAPGNK